MASYGVKILRWGEKGKWKMTSLGFVVNGNYCPAYTIFNESKQQDEVKDERSMVGLFREDYPHLRYLVKGVYKAFLKMRTNDKVNMNRQSAEFTADPKKEQYRVQIEPFKSKLTVRAERQCLNGAWSTLALSFSVVDGKCSVGEYGDGKCGDEFAAKNDKKIDDLSRKNELKCILGLMNKFVYAYPYLEKKFDDRIRNLFHEMRRLDKQNTNQQSMEFIFLDMGTKEANVIKLASHLQLPDLAEFKKISMAKINRECNY